VFLGALPLVSVIATSGWFYWRNYRLYGDITSSDRQLELAGRPESAYSLIEWLFEPDAVPTVLVGAQGGGWVPRVFLPVENVLLTVAVILVAMGAARWLYGRWAGRGHPDEPGHDDLGGDLEDDGDRSTTVRRARLVSLAIAVVLPLTAWYQLSLWVSYSGTPLSRYLLIALPVLATGAAAACLGHPGALGRLVGLAVMCLQATFAVLWFGRWLGFRWPSFLTGDALTDLVDALDYAGMPRPALVLVLLGAGAAAGILLQAWALWGLGRRDVEPDVDHQSDGASPSGGPPAGEPIIARGRRRTAVSASPTSTSALPTAIQTPIR